MEKAINKYRITFISIFNIKCAIEGDNLTNMYCLLPATAKRLRFYKNVDGKWVRIKYWQQI